MVQCRLLCLLDPELNSSECHAYVCTVCVHVCVCECVCVWMVVWCVCTFRTVVETCSMAPAQRQGCYPCTFRSVVPGALPRTVSGFYCWKVWMHRGGEREGAVKGGGCGKKKKSWVTSVQWLCGHVWGRENSRGMKRKSWQGRKNWCLSGYVCICGACLGRVLKVSRGVMKKWQWNKKSGWTSACACTMLQGIWIRQSLNWYCDFFEGL